MDRRAFLRRTAAITGTAAIAGCLDTLPGSSEDTPDPVALSGGKLDYQGGMVIGRHGGPNGQIFYRDETADTVHQSGESADDREDLAWFHTLLQGLFPYHFERRDRGWEAEVIYVTDYSSTDWELSGDESRPQMPSPTEPETFAVATELTYVAESEAAGGMGTELFPFSEEEEATRFTERHEGSLVEFDEIDRGLVQALSQGGTGMNHEDGN